MHIGLISDTHIPSAAAKELPAQVWDVFRGVELILHAGDIYMASVLDELESIAPVLAAEGDDDYLDLKLQRDKRVKKTHMVNIEGVNIWVTHQYELRPWKYEEPPNVIVYGHTHESALENHDGVLKVSPGSATFPRYKYELGTVGLLMVNSGKAEAQIIQL